MHFKNNSLSQLAFKYRSGDENTLSRDLQSLRDATFYAAPRDCLNDPFEGRFDRTVLDGRLAGLSALGSKFIPSVMASFDAVSLAANELLGYVDKSGVFSLSYNPLNELIWSHYGGSHQGFCVGYDLKKLLEFDPQLHYCIDVSYGDSAPQIDFDDLIDQDSPEKLLQKILGVKSNPWSYEQEVRVVTTPHGMHEHDFRAIQSVYFGLRCPETTRLSVMETLAGRSIDYQQVVSPPASYRLESLSIPDAFPFAPKYKQNLAPILDGAISPEYLKPELKAHQKYLYLAAEIVRREPYCMEVQLVDFSGAKSTPDSPVIFVQYLRSPNKWVNHYLSLSEIDSQSLNIK
ncbi:DUF2971 domain-containing protein [Pseudomonas sp. KFB-139]|uniref:DUF2971 domain-containing protein n=1 Tax=Pseudomonas serbiensis TaxID=3064350 RepID=A0ABT9CMB0_9PSED|nr:DUF2971 domain-containing protein [Pseudomonas sp. KFB-138]MDO7926622.1 DUF2971 domain-containing protein [Pseudomonas sp. KFB-138]